MVMVSLTNKKKPLVATFLLLILVAVSFFAYVRVKDNVDLSREKEAAQAQAEYSRTAKKMVELFNNQQYEKSLELSKDYFSKPRNEEYKYLIYKQEGMTYLGLQNIAEAEKSLLAAEVYDEAELDAALLQGLSSIYEAKKDNKKAAEYVKKMIAAIKGTPEPTDDMYISGYEEKIRRLESTQ